VQIGHFSAIFDDLAEYQRQLSPSSIQSLVLQGGPMSEAEAREFEAMPYVSEPVLLRRWDDQAKGLGGRCRI